MIMNSPNDTAPSVNHFRVSSAKILALMPPPLLAQSRIRCLADPRRA
jgi:hypothetical protein